MDRLLDRGGAVRVLIANVYRGNRQLPALRDQIAGIDPAVAMVAEANRLGVVPGMRRLSLPSWAPREARSTAIYVRHGVAVFGSGVLRLSTAVDGVKYTEDRYAAWAWLRHGGRKWCAVSVHLNPGRDNRSSAQNAAYVAGLADLWRLAERRGYTPIVGGDWNRRNDESAKHGTPHDLARIVPGRVYLHGIDGLVVPTTLPRPEARSVILTGADHKGLVYRVGAA